jgi:hypothetical protein
MKKIYVGLGVLVLVGAVLVGVFWKKSGNQPANTNQEQGQVNNQANGTVNPSGSYSINELFTMNRPMKCSWKESTTGDKDVTNIIYISGKKFYQDVTMGDIGHAYTISNGEYLYIWNDFSGAASKMKITETETGIKTGQGTAEQEQKKDFICESWSPDNSFFNPPQGKDFKDVTEEMNQTVQGVNGGDLETAKQQICDSCQNAPTQELIDACLENAQCNQ